MNYEQQTQIARAAEKAADAFQSLVALLREVFEYLKSIEQKERS